MIIGLIVLLLLVCVMIFGLMVLIYINKQTLDAINKVIEINDYRCKMFKSFITRQNCIQDSTTMMLRKLELQMLNKKHECACMHKSEETN